MTTAINGSAPVPHLGVIRVDGEDAAKFLHAQLTQDFALLGLSEARLAAWCSPKGRVLASFIGFKRSQTEILLVCERDILAAMAKRLSMFVLRAKARVSDASDAFTLRGLLGPAAAASGGSIGAPWSRIEMGAATQVFLYPADGVTRALWVAPVGTPLPEGPDVSPAVWLHAEVRSGVATIGASLTDTFVPQMLNYESVGGVNFKKGCYPGQEVVARSQFRSSLKRRAVRGHAEAVLKPGDELFLDTDPDQPCATVVLAAPSPLGGHDAILSGQIAAFQAGRLHLGSAGGAAVAVQTMPYALLDDI
jgi:folate-binding protein YgfZ